MILNEQELKKRLSDVAFNDEKYIITTAKSGDKTLLISMGNENFYLHSRYEPVKEGINFYNAHKTHQTIILYGLGLCHHINRFLESLSEEQELYIFENDIQTIKLAFTHTDIEKKLCHKNVFFYFSEDLDELIKKFTDTLIKTGGVYVPYLPSLRLVPDFEAKLIKRLLEKDIRKNSGNEYILMLRGRYKYDTICSFENDLADSFKKLGCDAVIIDVTMPDYRQALINQLLKNIKFVMSFDGIGRSTETPELKAIFDEMDTPFISLFVDHPVNLKHRLSGNKRRVIYTWVDRNHIKFMERFKNYFPNIENHFLPHGGDIVSPSESVWDNDRPIDLLFSGGIVNFDSIHAMIHDLSEKERDILLEICAFSLYNPRELLIMSFEEIFRRHGYTYSEEEDFLRIFMNYSQFVDSYVRAYRRYGVIQEITAAGIHLTCFGTGWERTELMKSPYFHFEGPVEHEKQRQIFREAKIILNVMPEFKDGSHERVFSSMLNGAVCLTDRSIYLEEEFKNGHDIVFYDADKISELPDIINNLLNNGDKRREIARNAFEKAQASHTWFQRAEKILELTRSES